MAKTYIAERARGETRAKRVNAMAVCRKEGRVRSRLKKVGDTSIYGRTIPLVSDHLSFKENDRVNMFSAISFFVFPSHVLFWNCVSPIALTPICMVPRLEFIALHIFGRNRGVYQRCVYGSIPRGRNRPSRYYRCSINCACSI